MTNVGHDDEEEGLSREDYLAWRTKLHDMADQSWDQLSHQILYLSSGALGLSVTFVGFFLQKDGIVLKETDFLFWSWVALGAGIVCSLGELGLTIIAAHQEIKDLDAEYKGREVHSCSCCRVVTIGLFVLGILLFMIGVALMLVFAWKNIGA